MEIELHNIEAIDDESQYTLPINPIETTLTATMEVEVHGTEARGDESPPLVDALDNFEDNNAIANHEDITGSLLGFKRKDVEELYDLYCRHARELGFGVRRHSTKYNTNRVLVGRVFVCSHEGSRRNKDKTASKDGIDRTRHITRTGCMAALKMKLGEDGCFHVVEHIEEHNHPLTRRELNYMHRSQRSISTDKAVMIEDMISSGVRPIDSFRYMVHDAGGEHLLGHTQDDHMNFVSRLKMSAIEAGDAQTLMDILQQKSDEDEGFFFRVKFDENGRLCSVFWRDAMMKEDYMIFGDVVVFDTTYRTNRYNLICAPFVGINNHWKNVMFGCAFLANEKTESFQWLFETFKKSMSGKVPVTVLTDQDRSIANGIGSVFPDSRHRLCIWHLYQNAISRFGTLKSNKKFIEEFEKCLTGCTNPAEFQICWRTMISRYGLQENLWFKRLYDLREKWCTGYNKDFFSAGILSSQRSESTNSALCFKANKTTSLNDFFIIFQKTVDRWRQTESKDEFNCVNSIPKSRLPLTGVVKHASEVYTLTLFQDFEQQFLKSISNLHRLVDDENVIKVYHVTEIGEPSVYTVSFDSLGNLVTCSCKMFEESGLLCSHCLRILNVHSIQEIPSCYILKRWRKDAKEDLWCKFRTPNETEKMQRRTWRNQMIRLCYNLVLKSENIEGARKDLQGGLTALIPVVESHQPPTEQSINEVSTSSEINQSINPLRSVTKGRKPRIKSHQKPSKKLKTTKASTSNQSKEIGTITPNQRLF